MKRGFAFALLVVLVFIFVNVGVQAQIENPADIKLNITNSSSLREKSNKFLEKDIEISENWQTVARVLFGMKKDVKVDLQIFVILIVVWIGVYLLLKNTMKIIPFFEGWKAWVGGILIMLLIGISGGLIFVAQWIYTATYLFGALKNWSVLRFGLTLILLVGVYYLFSKISVYLSKKADIEGMRGTGENIHFASEMGEVQRDVLKEK